MKNIEKLPDGSMLVDMAKEPQGPAGARLTGKVMIAVPSRNNSWWSDFGLSLAAMTAATAYEAPNVAMVLDNTFGTGLAMNRIKLCKVAIERGCTHVLFLDDDMRIPMHTLMMFLAHRKDIVAANCARKELPPRSTAKNFDGNCVWTRKNDTKLEEVLSVGTAVMLISTDMLKKLPQPWFSEVYKPEDGTSIGEDVYFCNLARKHGFQVWIDHDISKDVVHMGGFEFCHQLRDEWDMTEEEFLKRKAQ